MSILKDVIVTDTNSSPMTVLSLSPTWVILGSIPYGKNGPLLYTYSEEGKVPAANPSYGAMECTVNGRYYNLTAIYEEEILHVLPLLSLIYADLFNRCFFVFLFSFFLPVQVNTPAGLKGQEVTRSLPPLDYSPHCGPTSWPSFVKV